MHIVDVHLKPRGHIYPGSSPFKFSPRVRNSAEFFIPIKQTLKTVFQLLGFCAFAY